MISLSWTELKTLATSNLLEIQFTEKPDYYDLYINNGSLIYYCVLNKSTPANPDQQDFETNYKSTANGKIKSGILLQGADSVGQGTNYVNATATGEVKASDILSNSVTQGSVSVSVAGSPVEIKAGASPLANRKSVLIQAQGSGVVYGFSAGSQPFQIAQGTQITLAIGPNIPIFVDRTSGNGSVVVAFAEFS